MCNFEIHKPQDRFSIKFSVFIQQAVAEKSKDILQSIFNSPMVDAGLSALSLAHI
uniref:Uncharacterized protein n=1 Tax=Arion vulgaris TaxID=1028688 RepID=A0A0B7AV59_9EUPU